MVKIKNRVYRIEYIVTDKVYISALEIEYNYRGNGYYERIINSLQKKYNKPICLKCWYPLLPFYRKLGFEKSGVYFNGYYEMIKPVIL